MRRTVQDWRRCFRYTTAYEPAQLQLAVSRCRQGRRTGTCWPACRTIACGETARRLHHVQRCRATYGTGFRITKARWLIIAEKTSAAKLCCGVLVILNSKEQLCTSSMASTKSDTAVVACPGC